MIVVARQDVARPQFRPHAGQPRRRLAGPLPLRPPPDLSRLSRDPHRVPRRASAELEHASSWRRPTRRCSCARCARSRRWPGTGLPRLYGSACAGACCRECSRASEGARGVRATASSRRREHREVAPRCDSGASSKRHDERVLLERCLDDAALHAPARGRESAAPRGGRLRAPRARIPRPPSGCRAAGTGAGRASLRSGRCDAGRPASLTPGWP